MNLNDIMESTDRQKIFDNVLEEACRQWCVFIPESPERMDGEGFSNFFYEIFAQKEKEYIQQMQQTQEQAQPSEPQQPQEQAQPSEPPQPQEQAQAVKPTQPAQPSKTPEPQAPVEPAAPENAMPQPQKPGMAENETIQALLKLLNEQNMTGKAQDVSRLAWYIDGMSRQLDNALNELQQVKGQLAGMQESPAKGFFSNVVAAVESRIHAMQDRLSEIKDNFVEGARQAVEGFKQAGITALDKTVSFLGIKDSLNAMQEDVSQSLADTKKSIDRIETIGHELRSVGGHLKNVGRAVAYKEQEEVTGGVEGRFQAAILAPMRGTHTALCHIQNATLAAIGNVERLEQAAEAVREKKAAKQAEKPSVLKDLQELKVQAEAAAPAPAQDKQLKPKEASL